MSNFLYSPTTPEMLSFSVQPSIKGTVPCPFSVVVSNKPCLSAFDFSSVKAKSSNRHSLSYIDLNSKQTIRRTLKLSAAASTGLAPSEINTEISDSELPEEPQELRLRTDVKSIAKPRLVLKFIWMEKNIGLGLDQIIPGHGSVPLSPYFFWPRKDAWEELKNTLESKPWISQKKMIILLNQATDIINLWQKSGGNMS